jgi:hypothetical protein
MPAPAPSRTYLVTLKGRLEDRLHQMAAVSRAAALAGATFSPHVAIPERVRAMLSAGPRNLMPFMEVLYPTPADGEAFTGQTDLTVAEKPGQDGFDPQVFSLSRTVRRSDKGLAIAFDGAFRSPRYTDGAAAQQVAGMLCEMPLGLPALGASLAAQLARAYFYEVQDGTRWDEIEAEQGSTVLVVGRTQAEGKAAAKELLARGFMPLILHRRDDAAALWIMRQCRGPIFPAVDGLGYWAATPEEDALRSPRSQAKLGTSFGDGFH